MNLFYWLLISVALATGVTFAVMANNRRLSPHYWPRGEVASYTAGAFFISSLVAFFVMVLAAMSFTTQYPGDPGVHAKPADRYDLRALNLEGEEYSRSSGAMFLLIGGYSSESGTAEEIQYIKRDADGGMTVQTADLDDSRVFEENADTAPYVEVINYRYDISWYWPGDPWYDLGASSTDYEFHVPAGTVVQEFNVDITAE